MKLATLRERHEDRASDHLINEYDQEGGFSLDEAIVIGGYCIDAPSVLPAGACRAADERPWDEPQLTIEREAPRGWTSIDTSNEDQGRG